MLKADMVRLASGTTFLEISKADFSRIRTNRPKHPEQRRIAFVLDTMDEAIAKTEAVIAKLKQVRAGLLHDLLTRGLDENDQLRDPIAHPEQFQDSPLGCIPRDWVTAEIATLCDLGRGRVISQLDLEKNPGIYPVYSSQSANEGVFGYLGTFDFDGDYVTWTTDGANAGTVFFRSGRFNCTNVCGTLQSRGEKAIVRSLLEIDGIILIEKLEQEKLMMIESGLMADLLTGCVRVPEGVEIIAERQKGEHQEP
jgi:type I restriction enzyme S subunit